MCPVRSGRTTRIPCRSSVKEVLVVAVLAGASRSDDLDPASMSDAAIADELVELRREIDAREARFARLAWAGHQRGIGAIDGAASTQA